LYVEGDVKERTDKYVTIDTGSDYVTVFTANIKLSCEV